MIKEYQYTNIRRVLDELHRHPLLSDLTLEQVISYVVSFIGIFGMPRLYQDKESIVCVNNYRAMLPCDLISINQIKSKDGICLRSMTDNFYSNSDAIEPAFKTQGQVLHTSFKTGEVVISYKAIPIDEDGLPLLIDNPIFLKALESYIKREVFTILFDMGKVSPAVLQNSQQSYAWLAGQLQSEFTIPSISEMESIKNSWCTLLQRTSEFKTGFKNNGNREYLKI
jgi:hypothetical protein